MRILLISAITLLFGCFVEFDDIEVDSQCFSPDFESTAFEQREDLHSLFLLAELIPAEQRMGRLGQLQEIVNRRRADEERREHDGRLERMEVALA